MDQDFQNLIQRVVAGDTEAASELVRDFEPEVRRIVRFRLKDSQLRRVFDSTDICQSVFGQFFCLAELGRYEFSSPQDLINLLARMASNRVIDRYRTEKSQRRLRLEHSQFRTFNEFGEAMDRTDPPEHQFERAELLDQVRQRLSPEERKISQLRTEGCSWLEVAQRLGNSPQALRKRLERACQRVFEELGIE